MMPDYRMSTVESAQGHAIVRCKLEGRDSACEMKQGCLHAAFRQRCNLEHHDIEQNALSATSDPQALTFEAVFLSQTNLREGLPRAIGPLTENQMQTLHCNIFHSMKLARHIAIDCLCVVCPGSESQALWSCNLQNFTSNF